MSHERNEAFTRALLGQALTEIESDPRTVSLQPASTSMLYFGKDSGDPNEPIPLTRASEEVEWERRELAGDRFLAGIRERKNRR